MTVMFGSLLAYVGMVQQIFADVFHRAEPDADHVCAVRGVHGHGGVHEFAHGGAFGHAPDLAHGAAGVHRRDRRCTSWSPRWGESTLWTFVVLQALHDGGFSLSVSNFGAMAMEPVGSVAGIGASLQGFMSTVRRGLRGRRHRPAVQRQHRAARRRRAGLRPRRAWSSCCCAERGRLFRRHHADPAARRFAP